MIIDIFPTILALTSGLIVFLFVDYLLSQRTLKTEITIRQRLVSGYVATRDLTVEKVRRRNLRTKSAIDSLGNIVVKEKYASRLKQMLVTSGDWESKDFSGFIRRKLLLAITGFMLLFLLLLFNNLSIAPIILAICLTLYFLPDMSRYFRKFFSPRYVVRLEKMLDRAGNLNEDKYIELVKKKLLYAAAGFVMSYLYLLVSSRSPDGIIKAVVAIAIGFFLPDLLLQNKVIKRKEMIANTLPDALDMLQMCVGAGLAFPAALARVAETESGPIAEEFARVTTEVQLGKSRSEALAAMAERTQERSVEKFVNAMQQVTTFGIPILNVILEQAKELRSIRRERARERAQKVPVKILGPIMLFFLPSVLIIIIGPGMVSIFTTLG